jgi:hypothetical protein
LDIFKGLPFYFENYSLEVLSYLIDLFGLSSLRQFICENLPHPQNIDEAIVFCQSAQVNLIPMFSMKV